MHVSHRSRYCACRFESAVSATLVPLREERVSVNESSHGPAAQLSSLAKFCTIGNSTHVASFGESKSLADADSWAAIERKIDAAWLQLPFFSALRPGFVCICAVYVRPSMHGVYVVTHQSALGYEDRKGAILTTSRQSGVAQGVFLISRSYRVKLEHWVS